MARCPLALFLCLAVASLGCGSGTSSEDGQVPGGANCGGACTIELFPVVSLGTSDDQVFLDDRTDLALRPGGGYVAISAGGAGLAVFDSLGNFVRGIGSNGDGPGEYRGVFELFSDSERIYAARRDGRTLVLDANGGLLSELSLPARCRVVDFPDHAICVGPQPDTVGKTGRPFHRWSPVDGKAGSFGPSGGGGHPSQCTLCRAVLGVDPDGGSRITFFAVEWPRYRVERWTLDGDRLGALVIGDSAAFDGIRVEASELGPSGMASVTAVISHAPDSIWIARSVDTSTAHYELLTSGGWVPGRVSVADLQESLIGIVELVDMQTGVVARTMVAGRRFRPLGRDLFWTQEYAEDGAMRLVVWMARLQRPS